MRRRLLVLALLAMTAIPVPVAPAAAKSPALPTVVLEDCRERLALVPGVEERVRQRVPAQFELVRDPLGRPLLGVVGARCERYAINEKARPTTFAFFVALIESPDGTGCLSRWPLVGAVKPDLLPVCNFYALFAVYDNRTVVKTYRAAFPGAPIRYVRNLAFEAEDFDLTRLGAPWSFRAGGRTPSPFELDAIVRDLPLQGPATYSFYLSGPSGPAGGRFEVDDSAIGQMDATLRAAPGSGMAKLFGTATPTPLLGVVQRYHHAEGMYLGPAPKSP